MTTEQFYAIPMNERAVLVAKDIIAQVEVGMYKPRRERYLNLGYGERPELGWDVLRDAIEVGLDVKENFHLIPKGCTACAIGATILSCTHLGNKLKFSDLRLSAMGVNSLNNTSIKELLESVFSPEQLLMIETAFEGWNDDSDRYAKNLLGVRLEPSVSRACDDFHNMYNTSYQRILAIYQNIIDNNGVFVP